MTTGVDDRVAEVIKRAPCDRAEIAEIGVFKGAMSARLLKNPAVHLIMVDSWAPPEQQRDEYKATGDYHANASAEDPRAWQKHAETATAFAGERRCLLAMESSQAAKRVKDGSLDVVFIDGDHSYGGVVADIGAWWPKVKAQGWIGGHDYDLPGFEFGVKRAVDEWVAATGRRLELGANYTWWGRK